ncbi:hypothetical protein [Zooshikella ganghwensis]|uniref:hypothetical protein n=1 Tax=Zooshikella ganghwensis TaxID=202772 RepID=UPI0004880A81|nr:hypothetical protein [Zooshikella ganghwensis]
MDWKSHPYRVPKNIIELAFQSPIWIVIYGSGLIFPLTGFIWLIYGLGLYMSPKLYPLPHTALLELVAEYLIWIRKSSKYSDNKKKTITIFVSILCIVAIPVLFVAYFKFLFGLWFGDQLAWFNHFLN